MVEEGEPDPEFEAILDTVDPNRSVTCSESYIDRDVKCCITVRNLCLQGWQRVVAGVHGVHDQS